MRRSCFLLRESERKKIVLHELLPIFCYCKKIRMIRGYWQQVERYIAERSEADFSHGMCPECELKHFPDVYAQKATQKIKPPASDLLDSQGL
jgi:hypothetical protein